LRGGKSVEVDARPAKPKVTRLAFENLDVQLRNPTIGIAPDERQALSNWLVQQERYRIGVTLAEADDTLRQQLRLATGEGLVVTEVVADSPAAQAAVQTHDVLTVLDGRRLTTVDAINAQIQELKDKSVELRLLRAGKEISLQIAPRKSSEPAFRDSTIRLWDTSNCKQCHTDAAHHNLAWKLRADHSAWTDGHHTRLFWYNRAFQAQTAAGQAQAKTREPQRQLESLKSQLAEMQKTLAALEASLEQPPAKREGEAPAEPDKK
jgi:hypothetical protein